ncbi:MAG: hypothetical protein V1899_03085 [Planctomycetota bacterium]
MDNRQAANRISQARARTLDAAKVLESRYDLSALPRWIDTASVERDPLAAAVTQCEAVANLLEAIAEQVHKGKK